MHLRSVNDFARFARESRVKQGHTQRQFAKHIGMSYSWVQQFERGEIKPSLEAAIKVSAGISHNLALIEETPNPVVEKLFEGLL